MNLIMIIKSNIPLEMMRISGKSFQTVEFGLISGIHRPPGPGTDRSESVQDSHNFVGPGPVRNLEIVLGPGPVPALIFFSVPIRIGPSWS